MKLYTTAFAALSLSAAMISAPAFANQISDVDHPDVPNCTIVGPNDENCETLTMQAIYPPNGINCTLGGKYVEVSPGVFKFQNSRATCN